MRGMRIMQSRQILMAWPVSRPVGVVGVMLAMLGGFGCSDDTGAEPEVEVRERAASVQLVEGDGQTAEAGATLATRVTVLVVGTSGNPLSGIIVRTTLEGGGTATPPNATTASDGRAVFSWTLGSLRGIQRFTAQVSETGVAAVTASATATRPLVTRLTLTAPASLPIESVAEATVTATDARGSMVSDAEVSWSSSNTAAATVAGNGMAATVTAVALGITTLSATADGTVATQTLAIRSPFAEVSAGANHTCAR